MDKARDGTVIAGNILSIFACRNFSPLLPPVNLMGKIQIFCPVLSMDVNSRVAGLGKIFVQRNFWLCAVFIGVCAMCEKCVCVLIDSL